MLMDTGTLILYFLVERGVSDGCLESPFEVRQDS